MTAYELIISDWSSDVCSSDLYPAVGVGGAAALDVDELALEHFGDLARPAGADREARVSARHLAHRGHDSGGAAGEALGQPAAFRVGLPLVDRIAFLAHRQPRIFRQRDQRVAGAAWQARTGQRRRDDAAVVHDEEHVHAAQFLDPAMLGGVKEDDLIVPLGDRLALRDEARGIVAAAFGGAGAARSEEHTSELQSLMRISYAVFCLTKKKTSIVITQV